MELPTGLAGSEMNSVDRYISQVSRHLMGLSANVRQDVLMELRSHILAQSETEAGDVDAIIQKMGPPKETARSYIQLYGYGAGIKVLVVAVSAFLASLTLPFSLGSSGVLGASGVSSATLVLLMVFLIFIGMKVGSGPALAAGVAASVTRFFLWGAAFAASSPALATEPVAILPFVLTTVAIAFVGYLAAPKQAAD